MDELGLDARGLAEGRSVSTVSLTPSSFEQSSPRRAIQFLHLLLIGMVVGPLVLAIIGGYAAYQSLLGRTRETLVRSVADAGDNSVKLLDAHRLVAARIDDLLTPLTDEQIRDREQSLHEQLWQQIKDLPEVVAAWVLDASGRELVSAKVYPVDGDVPHSDREDFIALKNSTERVFIWALQARSFEHDEFRAYFVVARRREGPDGQFRGITIVAISGNYLASFLNSVVANNQNYSVGILRDTGVQLARFPDIETESPAPDLLGRAIASGSSDGFVISASPFGGGQIIAYRRVGNYPIYVSLRVPASSVLHEWLLAIGGYFAIGTMAVLGFVLLCRMALLRTHREENALALALSLVHDRNAAPKELQATPKKLDEANEAAEYLVSMSRELRAPLNAIIRSSDVIMREELGPIENEGYRKYIANIYSNSGQMLQTIRNITSRFSADLAERDDRAP